MLAQQLLGAPLAKRLYAQIHQDAELMREHGKPIFIQGILVGDDPASLSYLRIKAQMCQKCSIDFALKRFVAGVSEDEVISYIDKQNSDQSVTGIIVQLPLPRVINRERVLGTVTPAKDIDAFFYTLEKNVYDLDIRPPTPAGMLALFDQTGVNISGKNVVIVGHGILVGRPLARMLRERGMEPTVVVQSTPNYRDIIASADVLFTGVGEFNLVKANMIKPGVVIIDAGYSKIDDVVYGDVARECAQIASFMTPPVGGVGPLTVAYLLKNAVSLAKLQTHHNESGVMN